MAFRGAGAAANTDDAFRADVFLRPYGLVSSAHVHADQEERVQVVSGKVRYRMGSDEQALGPRQTVSFPAGASHVWWNDGDSEAHLVVELRPSRGAEELFEALYALAREGRTDERGMPGTLELARLAEAHGFYRAGLPLAAQRPLLAALARAFGRPPPRQK